MEWWIWVLLGFLLLGMELMTTSLHFAFFGVGAIVVGFVVAMGPESPLWFQILLFTIISVVLLLFRRKLLLIIRQPAPDKAVDAIAGEAAIPLDDIAPGAIGKAENRGSAWSAKNVGTRTVARGERCQVERVDGITLMIRPESDS